MKNYSLVDIAIAEKINSKIFGLNGRKFLLFFKIIYDEIVHVKNSFDINIFILSPLYIYEPNSNSYKWAIRVR